MTALAQRHHVTISGVPDGPPMVFAHGFGCDQTMWRFVAPAFEDRYRVVLFDHVGAGRSDLSAYDPQRYSALDGYADDLLRLCAELDLHGVVLVAHSVSAMVAVLASTREPARFSRLVLVGPSPRYVDDEGYVGGFAQEDIDELLESLDNNYLGWSSTMAPIVLGRTDRPDLEAELTDSFCRTDPQIARRFAQVTFRSDNRADLARVSVPTLVLQCSDDVIAPDEVGRYVAEQIPHSVLTVLDATGHCPQLSAPEETTAAIEAFL